VTVEWVVCMGVWVCGGARGVLCRAMGRLGGWVDCVLCRAMGRLGGWCGLWTGGWVDCLSASLPLCLSASLPLGLSASLPLCLSASLPLCLSASLPSAPVSFSLPLPNINICSPTRPQQITFK